VRCIALLAALLPALLAPAALAAPPGHWEPKPSAPLPRQEAAFTLVGTQMHLVGGLEYGLPDSLRHDVYDTQTQTWSMAAPLPEPSHHVQGVEIGGRLYVTGGLQTLQFIATGHLFVFDPATGAWGRKTSMPAGRVRGAGAAVAAGGKLYYLGGLQDDGRTAVAMVDVYDPATDTWTKLPDMPTARDHLGAEVVDGRLYAIGGRQAAFGTETPVVEVLDLATRTWSAAAHGVPTLRAGFATAVVDGEIVTIGGETGAGPRTAVEGYDPATDAWRTLAPIPSARTGMQGVAFQAGAWIAGGATDTSVAASAELDVLFPGPRPSLEPPTSAPKLGMTVRREGRRIRITLRGAIGTRITLQASRGARTFARRTITLRTTRRRVVLTLRTRKLVKITATAGRARIVRRV
jgi:hypothetical protein